MKLDMGAGDRVRVVNRFIKHYNRTGWVRRSKGGLFFVELDGDGDGHETPFWWDEVWPITTSGINHYQGHQLAGYIG